MPSRRERCVYKEGGRRCPRDGSGNPSLCNPHRIAFVEEARKADPSPRPTRRAADAVTGIIDDFISGRPFDPTKVQSAINDFAWGMGGGYGAYHPDLEPQQASPGFDPGPEFHPPPNWGQRERQPPPPPEDPAVMVEARRVLGFGPREPITKEILRARHRDLAKRHHPDRGGSLKRMQEINSAVDVLSKLAA